jgi:hypothetical protein
MGQQRSGITVDMLQHMTRWLLSEDTIKAVFWRPAKLPPASYYPAVLRLLRVGRHRLHAHLGPVFLVRHAHQFLLAARTRSTISMACSKTTPFCGFEHYTDTRMEHTRFGEEGESRPVHVAAS